jgi:hypothetical protein
MLKNFSYLLIGSLIWILLQCHSPEQKFIKGEYSGDYPIEDLLTEVPALDENAIVPVVLEDTTLKAVFDKNSGRLVSFTNKKTGWKIQRRGYLSRSFRLAVPLPGRKDNCVYGERQTLRNAETSADHKKIIFTWDKLMSDCGKELNILFTGIIELTDAGLQFTAKVDNHSPYTVEALYWPYIGDLNVPKTQNNLNWMQIGYGSMNKTSIYPRFTSNHGYFGVDYPILTKEGHLVHFGLLGNDREGLYVGYPDTTDRHLVNFTFELKPGYEYPESTYSGTVPKTDSIGGKPAHIEYSCVHFVYVNSKETETTKPIVFQPYAGDWQKGADLYKEWRKKWIKPLPTPAWAKEVHSWRQIHINSSEDYPRSSYKNIVHELINYRSTMKNL